VLICQCHITGLDKPVRVVEPSPTRQLEVLGRHDAGGVSHLYRLRHISSGGRRDHIRPRRDVIQAIVAIAVGGRGASVPEQREEIAVGSTRRASEIRKAVGFLDGAQRPDVVARPTVALLLVNQGEASTGPRLACNQLSPAVTWALCMSS
jgi:hypothetical protein